ncbi:hypothetical protein HG535_0B01120 [Zygotorulaspora mrakii]|uniref:Selenoprotein O n=1 Tax=Zygotorulaspora mrakii TaxID=42260 RepID=A0A7H9AY82_ZYGMR|nr:uncharacterized protein HG535_0B01120 [Zygotorulaspora mrakii]QLG71074.1 hypothetical protein HG535_0B01120 [Zygotorulaspora mrakii]
MGECRHILKVLKESGRSRFIKELTPDALVPTIEKAIKIANEEEQNQNDDSESDQRLRDKAFHTPRTVSRGCHFAYTIPEKRPHYNTLLKSPSAHAALDLHMDDSLEKLLSGENFYYSASRGIFPYSTVYAGFQFGEFAGQLGDGRVVNLFDVIDSTATLQTLELKGSGLTPFSRFADGKAVLRSSIREFIISEALYNIGIPSTRALQITLLPGTRAQRGMISEPTAVVCRVAPSWLRLGSFDLFRWKPDLKGLLKLTDYTINEVFSHGKEFPKNLSINIFKKDFFPYEDEAPRPINTIEGVTQYDLLFRHVARKNANCVAYWQAYGFLNGVLNTDNVSIMGLSMDFGPFNFLDKYQPNYTPNHDDILGRYSYENQPAVIWWNIIQFAQSLSILIGAGKKHIGLVKSLQDTMGPLDKRVENEIVIRANDLTRAVNNEYKFIHLTKYAVLMSKRLGIELNIPETFTNKEEIEKSVQIVEKFRNDVLEPLFTILKRTQIDYNNFFVNLQNFKGGFIDISEDGINGLNTKFASIFFSIEQLKKLRNFYAGNRRPLTTDAGETRLITETYDELIKWANQCSNYIVDDDTRISIAKKHNPLFIPRSWILQEVIDDFMHNQKAKLMNADEEVDTTLLQKLYLMSSNPFNPDRWDSSLKPEVEKRWANLNDIDDPSKFMQKNSCSS